MTQINRRQLLAAGAGAAGIVVAGASPAQAAAPPLPSDPFALSVASGDPTPTSVVLWTRLAPNPTTSGYGMAGQPDNLPVKWRIATTTAGLAADSTSVDFGTFPAAMEDNRSIHAVANGLTPNTHYVYRFWYTEPSGRQWASDIGNTRTMPDNASTDPVRFVVSSCQSYGLPTGRKYFNGWGYLCDNAAALDVDFVVQVGDYIYADPNVDNGDDVGPCETLPDYRLRYGSYRMRDSLQRIHRTKPFFSSPDDHEWWNNVHGGASGLDGHTVEQFNWAMRAYWEHMPLRYRPVLEPSGRRKARFDRHIRWGSVLDLFLVDTRQFRTLPGTGTGATLLGIDQRTQLLADINASTCTWTSVASQVPMGSFTSSTDKWVGYPHERGLVTAALSQARANGTVPDAVVVSGDIHQALVARVNKQGTSTSIATEFVGPALSSQGSGGFNVGGYVDAVFKHNGDPENGFLLCHVSPTAWDATYYLGHDIGNPQGAVRKGPTYRTVPGTVGATPV